MTQGGPRLLLHAAPGIPLLGPSGASAHVRGIAGALRPDLLVCARTTDRRGAHGAVDVPVVEVGVPGWPSWLGRYRDYTEVLTARRVARAAFNWIADNEHPALVWERHSLYSDAGWKVHAATSAPWVLEVNAPLVTERTRFEAPAPKLQGWARAWERDVLRAAPLVVGVSAWLCTWLREEIGCRRVLHVPNGVEPHIGDRDRARRELGLEGKLVLGFLGSMKPWHGVERLVALLDAMPDAVGLAVGEGPVVIDHPRIVRAGQVSEARAADLVAAMDIGLAPYRADAPAWFCPLKLLAYRAQGVPVVSADIGDCRLLTGEGGSVVGDGLDEWVEVIRAWGGRRSERIVRSWGTVVDEVLAEVRGATAGGPAR